jgi:uncharacterized 2Fe-2S/4Fe-4S cluster protein (DUF4445 family)
VLEGDVPVSSVDPRAFTPDELRDGWRLACRAPAHGDLVIDVPPLQTRPEGGARRRRPPRDPAARGAEAPPRARRADDGGPALGPRAVCDALEDLEPRVELAVLRTLGACCARELRRHGRRRDDVLIDVEPGDTTARRYAIAFDLGTTTVVATLLDLETGTPAAVRSMLNRQQPFGADVISRISATMMDEARSDALQRARSETLAQLADEVCERRASTRRGLRDHACGNVTMTQLALGHGPRSRVDGAVRRHHARAAAAARADFGVPVHPARAAFAFPSLGAYVGGDIVGRACSPPGLTRDRGCGCSSTSAPTRRSRSATRTASSPPPAPAGPAFEAAQIRCGHARAPTARSRSCRIRDGGSSSR